MSGRRWMRFVRLLVACVAFFVALPAQARPSSFDRLDRIVLVAEKAATRPAARRVEEKTPARRAAHVVVRTAERAEVAQLRARVPGHYVAREPLVLVPRKYLRHCALLC